MKKLRILLLCCIVLLIFSCYHARIETELSPSAKVVDKPFASSWILGLVPPSTVKAAMECENGVAVVETELSFVNQLVGIITLGIYTPMHIKITCAEASSVGASELYEDDLFVLNEATDSEKIEAFEVAAKRSALIKMPVYIHFQ
jgi:hypothetical protein